MEYLKAQFHAQFGRRAEHFFSTPGRTELGGNHTDHQHGRVLAAAVDLDMTAAVAENGTNTVRLLSEGYPLMEVKLTELDKRPEEAGTTAALVRGILSRFAREDCVISGFDTYITSRVMPGSGLSSSAAFEVLIGTILNHLFFDRRLTPAKIAQIGQWAENEYFGKPCGLMDQLSSAVGGVVFIDFADPAHPAVEPISFDFASCGYTLCIVETGADHADLTEEYAAIPREMATVAAHFGKTVLRDVSQANFCAAIPELRKDCGDRAVLRALHFYQENSRALAEALALREGKFDRFLSLVATSGASSILQLQNIWPTGATGSQAVAVALAAAQDLLGAQGAVRVHGGGFAGTIQAFVPNNGLEQFKSGMEAILGTGCCHVLHIRPTGGCRIAG